MSTNPTLQSKPGPEEIAALAYAIWQKGGCKPGTDLENWLQAEKQLNHRGAAAAAEKESAKASQKVVAEVAQGATSHSGSTQTNHLRRTSNARLQNHLART